MSEEVKDKMLEVAKILFKYNVPIEQAKFIGDFIETQNNQLQQKENIIKEVREKIDSFDVFKEFTFPLMKRDEEQQVKSSIDYEWRKSIKKPILEILDKEVN